MFSILIWKSLTISDKIANTLQVFLRFDESAKEIYFFSCEIYYLRWLRLRYGKLAAEIYVKAESINEILRF